MTQVPSKRQWSTSLTYSLIGAVLGFGAPLGYLALRTLLSRTPVRGALREAVRTERTAYAYMTVATPIVFGAFGNVLGRRLEKLRRAHEQIDRMHAEFTAITAHDLRTPLTSLLLRLELLCSDVKDGSVNVRLETVEKLLKTGRHLDRMVNDLLDATRIEAAKLRLDLAPVALPDAVATLVDRLRPTVGDHTLELAVEGSPPLVMADPTRLDRIVTNLVDNAAKYSPPGTPIRIEIRPAGRGVTLAVQDRGHGIAPADLPRLFERYYQTAHAREKKSGLGLGLYITKGLVEAHGGTITVESRVNVGSTFSVWLPAAPSAP